MSRLLGGLCSSCCGADGVAVYSRNSITRFYSCAELPEPDEEEREAASRAVLVDLLHAGGDWTSESYRRGSRRFTRSELKDIEQFRRDYFTRGRWSAPSASPTARPADVPWGNPASRGGSTNSWDTVNAASYLVRGPSYLEDKKKVPSAESLAELVLVDLFEATEDIPCISRCAAAGTVARLRGSGENRRLLLLNFRCNPVHLVLVFALPAPTEENQSPARDLLESFFSGSMSEKDMGLRLKIIPRPLDMPWVLKKVLGETPAILGKKIPLEFFHGDAECEVSINVVSSAAAKHILAVLKSAASALNLELAVVLEAQDRAELPEQLIGGFHVMYPDLGTTRLVTP